MAFPLAETRKENRYPVLKNGIKVVDMGEPFGKVFLFRIRSPFGWDSVYGFAETAPAKEKKKCRYRWCVMDNLVLFLLIPLNGVSINWEWTKSHCQSNGEFERTGR